MDLHSCKNCGVVMDMDKTPFIHSELPDNPEDEKKRDEDGYFNFEIECHYNPDIIWGESSPLNTWQCPVCKEFNGKGEE